VRIPLELLEEVVAHAREEAPNECCGVIGVDPTAGDLAVVVHRARNKAASPLRFEIDPVELLDLYRRLEERGLELGGIYHSHTKTPAYPSQTDVSFAQGWPGVEWLIVSLAGERPQSRCFLIEGAEVRETGLTSPDGSPLADLLAGGG